MGVARRNDRFWRHDQRRSTAAGGVIMTSEEMIRRIVKLVSPPPDRQLDCRDYVIESVEKIKSIAEDAPFVLKKKLLDLYDAMKRARIAIEQLPHNDERAHVALGKAAMLNALYRRIDLESTAPRFSPDIESLLSQMSKIEQESLAEAGRIDVRIDVRPRGGRGRT